MATELQHSAYAERNAGPILEVLRNEFANMASVLELGSGTGQHAAAFAAAMPWLTWQPTELVENLAGLQARVESTGLDNLLSPIALDVRVDAAPPQAFDGAYSANTAHIIELAGTRRMFGVVAAGLRSAGKFCLYGPFRQQGRFNTESNARFDASLRRRDPNMGIRDLETLDEFAAENDMLRVRLFALPANNHLAVWQKSANA